MHIVTTTGASPQLLPTACCNLCIKKESFHTWIRFCLYFIYSPISCLAVSGNSLWSSYWACCGALFCLAFGLNFPYQVYRFNGIIIFLLLRAATNSCWQIKNTACRAVYGSRSINPVLKSVNMYSALRQMAAPFEECGSYGWPVGWRALLPLTLNLYFACRHCLACRHAAVTTIMTTAVNRALFLLLPPGNGFPSPAIYHFALSGPCFAFGGSILCVLYLGGYYSFFFLTGCSSDPAPFRIVGWAIHANPFAESDPRGFNAILP